LQVKKFDKYFEGFETKGYELFGCHIKGTGVSFTLYAPHAKKVEVFTSKEDYQVFHKMELIDDRGIWYVEIPDTKPVYAYRYRIYKNNNTFQDKSDPYAFFSERRPANASCMYDLDYFKFKDTKWQKKKKDIFKDPMNIYEVHLNGFKKKEEDELTTYQEVKKNLIPYVKDMGFTHIELMPVFEHPFDGSWGYQATGFFSATSRYGTPYDLMDLINECHKNDIGVILDVVYIHFATDGFALGNFDFEPLYEYRDKKLMKTQWGSYSFDLGSPHVISFLMSSANFWIDRYHADGLRFDATSHFVYHEGNKMLGENKEGQAFVKRITYTLKKDHPSCVLIAEDSTDFPKVTVPTEYEGLGFDYKWDLGWMNDTLKYYAMDPIYRKWHHNQINFSMSYFYSEKFLLPLSHDEVVHSKATIVNKMWGLHDEKFSQCRNLFVYMYSHPGKKLNFMGNEIAQFREFDETKEMDWLLLKYPQHDSFKRFFKDLCEIYNSNKCLYEDDYDWGRFKWIDADNAEQSIYSFFRFNDHECIVTVLNMLPCSYENYSIGVPFAGTYVEIMNTEKDIYSGCNMCNFTPIKSKKKPMHNLPNTLTIRIAPYSAIMFKINVTKKRLEDYYSIFK